jgi:hypothetical protein
MIEVSLKLPNFGEVIIGEVTFFADLSDFSTENDGIGAYEYWGQKCYDRGTDYLHLEELNWDKNLYTEEQNKLIWDWCFEVAGGEGCPYQALCDNAEEAYAEDLEIQKENYALRNL